MKPTMKLKQLMNHFFLPGSSIDKILICKMADGVETVLCELTEERLHSGDYGGYENDPVMVFLIVEKALKVYMY